MHVSVSRRPARGALLIALAAVAFLVIVVRTAWLCDDAYISFRTVDNFVRGYGLRWNIDDRVQTFTHPLWLFVISAPYALTHEPYFTVLALSMIVALGAVATIVALAASAEAAAVGIVTLTLSRAFVDYSTSGLENTLTHLLVGVFFVVLARAWPAPRQTFAAALVVALAMTNRLDTGLLLLPPLIATAWGRLGWRSVPTLAAGMVPLFAWEAFSLAYYGFLFPNTAYAKLATGIPAGELARQGMAYLRDALSRDPLLCATIALGFAVGARGPQAAFRGASAGMLLHLAYVVRVGGDFMSGRFLTAPFMCAVAMIVRSYPVGTRWARIALPAGALAIGLLAVRPTMLNGSRDGLDDGSRALRSGIADERSHWYPVTGLLRAGSALTPPARDGRVQRYLDRGRYVVQRDDIGLFGFSAGRLFRIIDPVGLGDPLLARLPSQRPWRIGHFYRLVPEGYVETLETGRNTFRDPALGAYYDRLAVVTGAPIWTTRRWSVIAGFALGRYNHWLDEYVRRLESGTQAPPPTRPGD